uniref:Nucleosome assembly protein 1-like 1 n=1 Tax=Romanomermis culicivorax TaxID=13658 RepID=A0A915HN41_ROMCU
MDATGDSEKNGKQKSLLQDPLALAALQAEHSHEAHTFLLSLPADVRRRVNALKNLQAKARNKIVNGEYEPTDEEADFKSPIAELPSELKEKLSVANGAADTTAEGQKGIPDFWLTLFRHTEIIGDMIQEHDEPILKHLTNVEVTINKEPMAFSLQFYFSPNEYFTNSVLTKEYTMKCDPDEDDIFDFDGPEIVHCKGTHIDWKQDKNVTVKKIKKKQKHKAKGATRFVTKEVKTDSFFNFFAPPEETEDMDEDTKDILNADFEIGQIIRDRIVPRAVLYFTGEAHDEDDDDYEEDDEEEDECLSDEMESDDEEAHA